MCGQDLEQLDRKFLGQLLTCEGSGHVCFSLFFISLSLSLSFSLSLFGDRGPV